MAAMARLLIPLCALSLAACSAAGGERVASEEGRVRDYAGILDPATEARLTERLDAAERRYGPQVGIVTVPSLDGWPIGDFTTNYANDWGLGDKDRNDGLILLVAPNERQVRIGTGIGIEQSYPDEWCQEVIDRTLPPQFRQGNYGRGIEGAVDMIIARMRTHSTLPANDNDDEILEKVA